MNYNVKIDEFEGPMDLLLHLIKQSNINIQDIEINTITKQYLDYINKMEELNINVAASYIVMAAELMEIKSKSLLPDEEIEELEEEVSKENLINKLLDYQKYKNMVSHFKDMEVERQKIYIKSPEKVSNYLDSKIVNDTDTTIDDLVNAFKIFLERIDREKPLTTKITNQEYSIKDRKHAIKTLLKERQKVLFTDLFTENNRPFIIVTFLSVLELTKERELIIKQGENFTDIMIEMQVK